MAAPPEGVSPSLLDPRVMLMVPRGERAAVTALWNLETRLFGVVAQRRELVLAQIKLAWWRERLEQVASAPDTLPKGEPLLAELAGALGKKTSLAPVVDGYEAIMVAEDVNALAAGGAALAKAVDAGAAWGLARAAQLAGDDSFAVEMWGRVRAEPVSDGPRHNQTLDRWAKLLAQRNGAVSPRAEGWLLLRAGIGL